MARLKLERRTKFNLIIFDCDGVLIDSELISCGIQAEALSRLGYRTSSHDIMRRFTGVPTREMYRIIEEEWGRLLPDTLEGEVSLLTEQAYRDELRIVPGVREALDSIDVSVCVASSSTPHKLRLGLEIVDLYERLAPHIFSASQVARGKPAPDLFLFAADRVGFAPAECLVIEDSVAGVRAARAAGMAVLGFCGGSHCGADHDKVLLEAGADLTFSSMAALSELLGSSFCNPQQTTTAP
jgi:HAD superfamily hydrolase (TIGR01509 family)